MSAMENNGFDLQAQTYFDSLPPLLQTQIVESGVKLHTREDLAQYCSNALGSLGAGNPNPANYSKRT